MASPARPFSTEGGRKWVALWYLQALGICLLVLIVLQATLAALGDLQTDQMIQVFGLMATITGAFVGVQGAIDFRAARSPTVAESDPPTDTAAQPPSEDV
jgi:hypothetical protein